MHRQNLQQLLTNYQTVDAHEHVYKKLMLDFLNECPDCFERSCPLGHFTCSSWIVNAEGTQCLLMHHSKLDMWLQLGGHCDGESDVLAVAIKEAQEESGINNFTPLSTEIFDIDLHLFPTIKDIPAHYHFDIRFLLQAEPNAQIIKNNESKDLSWFDLEMGSLPTMQHTVTKMLKKYLELYK